MLSLLVNRLCNSPPKSLFTTLLQRTSPIGAAVTKLVGYFAAPSDKFYD